MTERERLIGELENYAPYAMHFPHLTVDGKLVLDILTFLREQPEQKHGHWISLGDGHYTCSCCKTPRHMNFVPNYCSECGARMDEEVKQDADGA